MHTLFLFSMYNEHPIPMPYELPPSTRDAALLSLSMDWIAKFGKPVNLGILDC